MWSNDPKQLAAKLRKAADEMRAEDKNGWPVLCDTVADYLEANPFPSPAPVVTDALETAKGYILRSYNRWADADLAQVNAALAFLSQPAKGDNPGLVGAAKLASENVASTVKVSIPANPAQVTDAMVEAACAAYHAAYPDGTSRAGQQGMRAALTAAIGAGGQAVAYQWRKRDRVMVHEENWSYVDYHTGLKIAEHPEKYEVRPLYTHPAPSGQAVAVKPLEWSTNWGTIKAETPIGHYFIETRHDGSFDWRLETVWNGWASSMETAKARAQADYERRILSAIGHPVQMGWQQVGWAYNDKRWDEDRWHVCGMDSKPRSSDGRLIQPIFIAAPQPKGE